MQKGERAAQKMTEDFQLAELNSCSPRTILGSMQEPSEPESLDSSEHETGMAADAYASLAADASELHLRNLIGRIAQGDELALGALYDHTLGRVYGLALRITRNRQTAEEVAEDVFFQVWRQALRFDAERGNAMAWILTIARSRALDSLRRADQAEPHAEPEILLADDQSIDGDPQDLLAATQRNDRLHAALAALDVVPRQLIALAFFRGLTHEEIAAEAAMPLGTVKSLIRRSLATLKSVLSPDFA